LAMDIREYGAIRLGDSGFYVGKTTKRTLHDAEGLLKWLDTPARIGKAIRVTASNVRIGVVRGYANEAAIGEDAVMDTFFEETVDEEALKKVPESKAKWVQGLGQGERR